MALIARTMPELFIMGTVVESRARSWEGEYRGMRATVETVGGPLWVTFQPDDDSAVPPVGTSVVLVVTVFESQRGASFSYVRAVTPGDLDALASTSGALVPAGK